MGMDGGCGRSEDVTCHFAHVGKVKGGDSGMVVVCDPIPHYMVAVDRERGRMRGSTRSPGTVESTGLLLCRRRF